MLYSNPGGFLGNGAVKGRCSLGLARAASDLRQQQVDTERRVLVLQEALELRNLLPQHVRGISNAADDTETAGIGNSGGELGAGGDVHAGQEDRVVDLEQISRGGAKLLCCCGQGVVSLAVGGQNSAACERPLGKQTYAEKPC